MASPAPTPNLSTVDSTCSPQKSSHSRKFVLVPDSHNWLKYIFASHRDPTIPQSEPTLTSLHSDIAFQFGVVADVQYANLPTARGVKHIDINGTKTMVRRRRAWQEAIPKLNFALRTFNKADVDFVVNLGDVIEGYGSMFAKRNALDFQMVLNAFKHSKSPVYHVIGNHCRNLPMSVLQRRLSLPHPYYSFCPSPGWRTIVLNSAELSTSAIDRDQQDRHLLADIIRDEARGSHCFHGALGQSQLQWLQCQLDEAVAANEYVIIFSHYPLADGSARPSHVIANTKAVRQIIERPQTPVVLCLAGHDHMGGRLVVPADATREAVTYVTMPAVLEAPRGGNAYAFVTAHTDGGVSIQGVGEVPSTSVPPRTSSRCVQA